MVRTASMSSTISTQPASKFLLTVQLLKEPQGHHASACPIPLTQIITQHQPYIYIFFFFLNTMI